MENSNLKISITTEENDTTTRFFTGKLDDLITETVNRNYNPKWSVVITERIKDKDGDVVDMKTLATKENGEWILHR